MTSTLIKPKDTELVTLAPDELVARMMETPEWQELNCIEDEMRTFQQPECPLTHIFTPHLYTRQIFMPKGTRLCSRIHLFEHPYFLLSGVVSVWEKETGWVLMRAPQIGITKPATRRVLFMHTDVLWATCHVTDETDPDTIVRQVTYTGGKHHELGGSKA